MPTSTNPSLSTTLTIETSLSVLYKVLRLLIRPLRPHLVTPGKPLPSGSPRLVNYRRSRNGVDITERWHSLSSNDVENRDDISLHSGVWLYDFLPRHSKKGENSTPKHRLLYFAGGGFQSPPASEHWSFVSRMAADLDNLYSVTLVSYPLAPNSPATKSLPLLKGYLRDVCMIAMRGSNECISLMGDSAGGNVVLSLGFWWAEQVTGPASSLSREQDSQSIINTASHSLNGILKNVLVISPACDMRSINPEIAEVDQYDPVLNRAMTEKCAQAWIGRRDQPENFRVESSDPSVSPVCQTTTAFQRMKIAGVRVHGVFGTYDVLAPDTEAVRQKLVEADVPGKWLRWEKQMHCFVLAGVYGMPEGKEGVRWCVAVLKDHF